MRKSLTPFRLSSAIADINIDINKNRDMNIDLAIDPIMNTPTLSAFTMTELLDTSTLAAMRETLGEEMCRELIERFLERLNARHRRMSQSLARKDRCDLAEAAHAMKGAASTMGCIGLAGIATVLERQAHSASLETLYSHIEELTLLSEQTQRMLVQQGYICSLHA